MLPDSREHAYATHPVFRLTWHEALRVYIQLRDLADVELRGLGRFSRRKRARASAVGWVASRLTDAARLADIEGEPLVTFRAPTYFKYWTLRAMERGGIEVPADRVCWEQNENFTQPS